MAEEIDKRKALDELEAALSKGALSKLPLGSRVRITRIARDEMEVDNIVARNIECELATRTLRTTKNSLLSNSLIDRKSFLLKDLIKDAKHETRTLPKGLTILVGGPTDGKTLLLDHMFQNCSLPEKKVVKSEANEKDDSYKVFIRSFESDYDESVNAKHLGELLTRDMEKPFYETPTDFPFLSVNTTIKVLQAAVIDTECSVIFVDGLRFLNTEARGTPAIAKGVLRGVFDMLTSLSGFVYAHNKSMIATLGTDTLSEEVNSEYYDRCKASVPLVIRPRINEESGINMLYSFRQQGSRRDNVIRLNSFAKIHRESNMETQRLLFSSELEDFNRTHDNEALLLAQEGLLSEE